MGIFVVSLIILKIGFEPFFGLQLSEYIRLNVVEFQTNNSFYSLLREIITLTCDYEGVIAYLEALESMPSSNKNAGQLSHAFLSNIQNVRYCINKIIRCDTTIKFFLVIFTCFYQY
jgi:hypothetical protein